MRSGVDSKPQYPSINPSAVRQCRKLTDGTTDRSTSSNLIKRSVSSSSIRIVRDSSATALSFGVITGKVDRAAIDSKVFEYVLAKPQHMSISRVTGFGPTHCYAARSTHNPQDVRSNGAVYGVLTLVLRGYCLRGRMIHLFSHRVQRSR